VELCHLPAVTILRLYSNQLTGACFTDVLHTNRPRVALRHVGALGCGCACVVGGIPFEFTSLDKLSDVQLQHNQLTGAFVRLVQMRHAAGLGVVICVHCWCNACDAGRIPAQLRYLSNLRNLNLSNNELSGASTHQSQINAVEATLTLDLLRVFVRVHAGRSPLAARRSPCDYIPQDQSRSS